jgi:hypothetical protein
MSLVPTNRKLSGPQSQFTCLGGEKNLYFVSIITAVPNNEQRCVWVSVLMQLIARHIIAFTQYENFSNHNNMHMHMHMHACANARARACARTHAHTHTHAPTRTHTHTHIYMQLLSLVFHKVHFGSETPWKINKITLFQALITDVF